MHHSGDSNQADLSAIEDKLESLVDRFIAEQAEQSNEANAQKDLLKSLKRYYVEHGIENQELRKSIHELNLARERYHLFFDYSPTACFIFNQQGTILEANLQAADLLNVSRHNLRDQQHAFTAHLDSGSYETFFRHLEKTLSQDAPQECNLEALRIGESNSISVRLHSRRFKDAAGDWEIICYAQKSTQ